MLTTPLYFDHIDKDFVYLQDSLTKEELKIDLSRQQMRIGNQFIYVKLVVLLQILQKTLSAHTSNYDSLILLKKIYTSIRDKFISNVTRNLRDQLKEHALKRVDTIKQSILDDMLLDLHFLHDYVKVCNILDSGIASNRPLPYMYKLNISEKQQKHLNMLVYMYDNASTIVKFFNGLLAIIEIRLNYIEEELSESVISEEDVQGFYSWLDRNKSMKDKNDNFFKNWTTIEALGGPAEYWRTKI